MTKIAVVSGTNRPNSIGPKVAAWILEQAPEGVEAELLDLAEVDLPWLAEPKSPKQGDYQNESTKAWAATVESYDGFVIAVAEYNGGYSAVLKNALDTVWAEWNGKPIGLVGYGWGGAARALTALEPVLGNVEAERVAGPSLFFDKTLTTEGEVLEGAPAAEVTELFNQVVAQLA